MSESKTTPELLAPAGSPEAVRAAVESGADAVYAGWGPFNARERAKGFTDEEFRAAVSYCRERGVRVYLTLNTLLTDAELPLAHARAREAAQLGVDAVLVQDWGLLHLLHTVLPELTLHASTQMSVMTTGGANVLRADGCARVVLARECSREDVAAILRDSGVEIEMFVHGALCVCCSGQCSMSALIGGRSGNRGRCAQPCRLPCRVEPMGARAKGKPAKPDERALSLKDLNLSRRVPELTALGVDCLKLEGRLKRAEYVAAVTKVYSTLLRENRTPTPEEARSLALAFDRGGGDTDGYWTGRVGETMRQKSVSPTDRTRREQEELFTAARARYESGKHSARRVPVSFTCTVHVGVPSTLTASDRDGNTVTVSGEVPEAARTRSTTSEELESRLEKTGGTAFQCVRAEADVESGLSLPARAVNALRRDALEQLSRIRTAPRTITEQPDPWEALPRADVPPIPSLTASVQTLPQLTALLDACGGNPNALSLLALPLELLDNLSEFPANRAPELCAILPRMWRDRDEPEIRHSLEHALRLGCTSALAGNIGHIPILRRFPDLRVRGDYGLNVFNSRALLYLREHGLVSACVSFELRMAQIRDLTKLLPAEAVVYGRLPLMITEQPLIPSPRDSYVLRDRTGTAFPLLGAYGNRVEMENSLPVYLADRTNWLHAGLTFARLRFTTEDARTCADVFRAYRDALDGTPSACSCAYTRGLYERGVQ